MSETVDVHLRICNLAEHPEHISTIASWHHHEWLKGLQPGVKADMGLAEGIEKRAEVLRSHFVSDSLPRSFVALYKAQPIATVSLAYFGFTPKTHERSLWLTNLFVVPELRGMGLGALLLDYAFDYACEHELQQQRIMLYTRDKNEYYQKRGWLPAGTGRVQRQEVFILSKALTTDLDS
ncbi:GNAT family N-acetyltransferase [Agaribacterium sp. ZY112]|uniref:GNAT family N-acetyltransferase n=1 Tax=Agaribacterium sp. ZY112 TaxID=3233574 RepID=UPI003523E196